MVEAMAEIKAEQIKAGTTAETKVDVMAKLKDEAAEPKAAELEHARDPEMPEDGENNEQSNKKMKLTHSDELDLSKKISNQLEYYFSDVNVVKDRFMLEEFKKNDNWIDISTMLKFARLKEITTDENKVVDALKGVKSEMIELDESQKRLRRIKPMPDVAEYQKQLDLRTVHVSGFPVDTNFEALRNWCSQYGEVESVAMRRHFKTRFFKGCIHAVYKSEDDAKKVLADEAPKFKDRELRTESMEQYHKRKGEMAEKRAEKRKK